MINQLLTYLSFPFQIVLICLGGIIIWLLAHKGVDFIIEKTMIQYPKSFSQATKKFINPARRVQRAKTIGSIINSTISLAIVLIMGWLLAEELNLSLAPFLAGISIVGISIGFGTQQLIRDFIAGIFITVEDQFGIGDHIEVGTVKGVVQKVSLRITELKDEHGVIWYLRNGEIMQVGNHSQSNNYEN